MGYIGQQPNHGNLAADVFSGDGSTTGFTLSYSVGSANSISIYIDGVKQAVSTYTASGTTLTFTTAPPSGTNNVEVIFLALEITLPTPGDATVTPAKLTSDTRSYFNRNDIINGGYLVNQENNTSATDDAYSIGDLFLYVGENSSTTSLQTSGGPQGDRNFARINVDNANAQAGWVYFLESKDCQDYIANGALSFGIQAKTTSGAIDTIRIGILKWTGTADSITSDVVGTWASDGTDPTLATNWSYENTPSDLNLTTSWQRFTVENVTVDSDTKNIAIFIWTDDGTITANDQLDVTEWQLNPGATVHDFYSKPTGLVQHEVDYYLQRFEWQQTNAHRICVMAADSAPQSLGFIPFRAEMRTVPTITSSAAGTFDVQNAGGVTADASSIAWEHANRTQVCARTQRTGSGLNAGEAVLMVRDSTDTTWMMADARL